MFNRENIINEWFSKTERVSAYNISQQMEKGPHYQNFLSQKKSLIDSFKDRKDMLDFCNNNGMYIDPNFYNKDDVNDCAQFVIDANENYSDDLMWKGRGNNIDEYDDDYYISYHFDFAKRFLKDEIFWGLIFKDEGYNDLGCSTLQEVFDEDIGNYLEFGDIIDMLRDFKDEDNKHIVALTAKYIYNLKDWGIR